MTIPTMGQKLLLEDGSSWPTSSGKMGSGIESRVTSDGEILNDGLVGTDTNQAARPSRNSLVIDSKVIPDTFRGLPQVIRATQRPTHVVCSGFRFELVSGSRSAQQHASPDYN